MKKIIRIVEKMIDITTVIILILLVILVSCQVIFRFLGVSAAWTQEFARFSFVFITFFGSVICFREKSHIVVEFLIDKLPRKSRHIMAVVINFLVLAFLILVVWGSYLCLGPNQQVKAASASWFRMNYIYTGFIISCILMISYILKDIVRLYLQRINHD